MYKLLMILISVSCFGGELVYKSDALEINGVCYYGLDKPATITYYTAKPVKTISVADIKKMIVESDSATVIGYDDKGVLKTKKLKGKMKLPNNIKPLKKGK